MEQKLNELKNESNKEIRDELAKQLTVELHKGGINSLYSLKYPDTFIDYLKDRTNVNSRDMTVVLIDCLFKEYGKIFEPYYLLVIEDLIELLDDKVKVVAASARNCLMNYFQNMNPYSCSILLPKLFNGMIHISWKIKVGCLELLEILPIKCYVQISYLLPEIVPRVTMNMWDTKDEVRKSAKRTLLSCCAVISNPDIKDIVPDLVSANANPKETVTALDRLMGTTFVSQVDRSTLSIIAPLLNRALRDRDVQMKRKACVVVDNMCKLVCDSKDVEPFIEKLLPELKRVSEEVPIPEIREYGSKAMKTLIKAIHEGGGKVPENYR